MNFFQHQNFWNSKAAFIKRCTLKSLINENTYI